MSTEITTATNSAITLSEDDLMNVLESSLYPGAARDSIKMVIGYCKAAGLDPMQKPVHIVPMWDSKAKRMRDVIMPGVGLYRTQASRAGCIGVSEPEFGPEIKESVGGVEITYPKWCRVTAKRRLPSGEIAEFTAKEFWLENYATAGKDSMAPNAMWKRRVYAQLAKCAEAQALRKAFPEVGSMPTADEMEGKTIDMGAADVVHQQPATGRPALPASYPDDAFKVNLPKWREAIQAGKATAEQIIVRASSKGQLTDEQQAAIRAPIEAAPAQQQPDADGVIEQPAMTYAQVATRLHAAQTMDQLADTGSCISLVQDAAHRQELSDIYDQRAAQLEG